MHIKHIHETMEKLSKYACDEACKSVEKIDTKELGEVVDMISDLAEAEYHARIAKAMEESEKENEEEAKRIMREMKEEYGDEEGERRFYDNYRYKRSGRYAPKGRGSYVGRRGYEEPPYYHMTPEMYKDHDAEWYRDMDRQSMNRLYYTDTGMSGGNSGNMGGNTRSYTEGYDDGQKRGYSEGYERGKNSQSRDSREGRSGQYRRGYIETKEQRKDNTPENKQHRMKELEAYAKELTEDVVDMIADATPEEHALMKQKMQVLLQKL